MGMPHTIPFTVLLMAIILSIKVTDDTSNYKRFSQAFNDRFCKIGKNVFRLVEIIIITSPLIAQYMSAFLNTFLTAVAVSFTGCVSRGPESLKIPHLLIFFHQIDGPCGALIPRRSHDSSSVPLQSFIQIILP